MVFAIKRAAKLFTHEDGRRFHIHKILGIFSLLHYLYRFFRFCRSGSMEFDSSWFTLVCIFVHALLSGTSFIFKIPDNRVQGKPMIWPEFRLHSVFFAWRSVLPMLFVWFSSHIAQIVPYRQLFFAFCILLTMFLADVTSSHFKKRGTLHPDNTTMRMMPFPEQTSERLIKVTNLYYSVCQVLATLIVLYASDYPRLLMVMFPIQLAAFLMTLVRKSIITGGMWHVLYASFLGLNYVHAIFDEESLPIDFWLYATFFCVFRFTLNANKYLLWGLIFVMFFTLRNQAK
jgi:hypothetical protein